MGGAVSQGLNTLKNNVNQGVSAVQNNVGQGVNALGSNLAAGNNAINNNATQLYQGATSGQGTPWGPLGQRNFSMFGNAENWDQPYKVGTDFVHGVSKGLSYADPLSYVDTGNNMRVGGMDFSGLGLAPENYVGKLTNGVDNTINSLTTKGVQGVTGGISDKLFGQAAGESINPYNPANQDQPYNEKKAYDQYTGQQKDIQQQQAAAAAKAQAAQDAQTAANQQSFNQQNSLEDALRNAYLLRAGSRANGNGYY